MTRKFLVVDDDEGSRILLKSYIEAFGRNHEQDVSIDMACDGHEAIHAIVKKDGDYDLLLLDVKMPGLSGIDVFHFLKQNFSDLTRRTLWITGFTLDLEEFLNANKQPHLTKPFDIKSFHEQLEKFF